MHSKYIILVFSLVLIISNGFGQGNNLSEKNKKSSSDTIKSDTIELKSEILNIRSYNPYKKKDIPYKECDTIIRDLETFKDFYFKIIGEDNIPTIDFNKYNLIYYIHDVGDCKKPELDIKIYEIKSSKLYVVKILNYQNSTASILIVGHWWILVPKFRSDYEVKIDIYNNKCDYF